MKIRNCQATTSAANHTQPRLKASAFFPYSVAVILMVQERVAGDPLWLQIGEAFQAWATPLLITIGGLWAFYRFRLRRESRRRLKVEVAGRMERATGLTGTGGLIYLVITTTVTNIGDAEVDVDDTLLVLESLDTPPETTRPPWIAGWNDLLSGVGIHLGLAAFEGGRTLEPGEPVEDRAFLGLPDSGYGAIRVTATVASRAAQKSWFNDEVVVVDPRVDNGTSGEAAGGPAQTEGGAVIKTFKSTGIGNEAAFDEETAKEWRRKKEATRRFLEERRSSSEGRGWSLQERPNGSGDDAGMPDL